MKNRSSTINIIKRLSLAFSLAIACIPPLTYGMFSYQYLQGSLVTEAEINSRLVTEIINSNPDLWEYETLRLEGILSRRPGSGEKEIRQVVDLQGKIIAESKDTLSPPLIMRSHLIMDSGVEVGRIEIIRSLKQFLLNLGIFCAVGLALGLGIMALIRLPIRSLQQAEKELLQSYKLQEETSRLGRVGGWEINIETGEGHMTNEVYRIHELSPDDKMNLADGINFYSESSRPVIEKAIQRAIEENESYDLELEIITAKGNSRNVRAIGIPDLENQRLYGFFQDITEKKKFQETQLRSSQLAALGEVAAGVAHEINNPINGIINYAQLLINRNDENDRSNQILERIMKEGNRIANIVHNLLNFARKDRDEVTSFNLMDIIVEPLNLNAQFFKKDGIHTEVEIPEDLPEISGNKMKLEQVVLNLLSNARHALNNKFPEPSNEKFLVIDAKSTSNQNGGSVQLRIKDSGCGIPKEDLDKIFNPFFTTKEAGVGTGLGLSVSHDILENHGATISIDSQVNKFTQAIITFPVKAK